MTGRISSKDQALASFGSVFLDIVTGKIGSVVDVKKARYGLMYYSKDTGRYITRTSGKIRSLIPPTSGIGYQYLSDYLLKKHSKTSKLRYKIILK